MMRARRTGLLAALTAAATLAAGACGVAGDGRESVADKDSLVVGVYTDHPGLGLRRPDGGHEGFDIDVAREVAGRLGVRGSALTFRRVTAATREGQLREGAVDLVVASYSITQERKTRVSFAGPYYVAHQDILVRRSDAEKVRSVRDLAGRRLCKVEGSVSFPRVRDEKGVDVLPQSASGYAQCLSLLSSGDLDAVSTDDLILAGLAAQAAKSRAGGPPLRIVNAPISDEPYGIGLAPDDLDGCEAVNKAITEMYQDGTMARLLKTWFGPVGLNVTTTVPQFEGCD
ncbi:glutamate ABC transporter substrate-binding protein [Actinomadura viridis]|uniref:Glutamate transport system substrate-binding protein n=1 Tax=Actinomadura viridis TaxID=58110 RepID=A0A931GPW3_9ACTN|nr:glutamate ABC transporter substrate-binding protein [Actinomadura viridis]MBG6087799.1 glutamate transport system substrate-binding protein [Actinomadura viridis]